MKFLKYIAVALVVTAIIAVTAHLYRESIVRTFANRVLKEQDVVVTELAIRSLQTDYVYLSYLELEQVDGSRFMISGLSFPLDFPNVNTAEISIEKLRAVPAASSSASPSLAPVLQAFLRLPENIPRTGVSLTSIEVAGMPEISNFVWQSESGRQHLTMQVAGIGVQISSGRSPGDQAYLATINAGPPDSADSLSLDLSIRQATDGFSVDGTAAISLSPWLPVLKSFALLPVDILSVSGNLAGPLQIEIGQDASAHMQLSLADELLAEYAINSDRQVQVRTTAPAAAQINAEYPSARWNARVNELLLEVSTDGFDAIPLSFSDIQCLPAVRCTADLHSTPGPITVGATTVEEVEFSATLEITKGEQTNIVVKPGLLLTLGRIETSDYSVATAQASLASAATISFGKSDWQGDVDEMRVEFDTISNGEGITANIPLVLSRMRLRDSGSAIDTEYSVAPQTGDLLLGDFKAMFPGINGDISLQATKLTARGNLSDPRGAITGNLALSHSLDNGSGELQFENVVVDFAAAELSNLFLNWPYDWDLVSGTWATNAAADWHETDAGLKLNATISSSAQLLAGSYNDIAFAGLTTELKAAFGATDGVTIAPASMQMSLVEIGVPVRQFSADYRVDLSQEAIEVQNVTMSLLGGKLHADPFRISALDTQTSIVLRPEAIQLQFMVELAEFRNIELSGSISGVLPVAIDGKTITITDGRLENDPPGGVIRYLPGLDAGDSTLGLVSRALANFQFDSLTSTVNYTRDGDLEQRMRIEGMNPDMDDRQPVILNLNVENNIPSLLRSLQATRSIEEILERRSTR